MHFVQQIACSCIETLKHNLIGFKIVYIIYTSIRMNKFSFDKMNKENEHENSGKIYNNVEFIYFF